MSLDPYPGDEEILRRLERKKAGTPIDCGPAQNHVKPKAPRAVVKLKASPPPAHFKAAKDDAGYYQHAEGVIFGPARTKKNPRSGGLWLSTPGYKKWCAIVVEALSRAHFTPKFGAGDPKAAPYYTFPDVPLNLKAIFYVDAKGLHSDLVGLLQGFCDALEDAGIVSDDKWFLGFDGSRKLTFDTVNPRVEFWITPL